MKIKAYGKSDVGMRREKNEDSYLVNNGLGLFVVADGMGGHAGGAFASNLAVKSIDESILGMDEGEFEALYNGKKIRSNDYRTQLKFAIQEASNQIYDESVKNSALKGMGTTSVAIFIRNDRLFIANVGDSRCYLVRNGEILQLTIDHSIVGEQLRAGIISAHAAKEHKLKNIITRSVGFQEDVEIDVVEKIPREGDCYLLCSDGLTNMVDDDEILEILKDNSIEEAAEILIDMANARGGDDNITVVLTEITECPDTLDSDEDEDTIGI